MKKKIDTFVYCTECTNIIYNPYMQGNTNKLLRHTCYAGNDNNNNKTIFIKQSDKEKLKIAAAKFVSLDLRPFSAVQFQGLLELSVACMNFGQCNRKATREDLITAMPTRNTVQATVADIASKNREHISVLMKSAITSGGVAATTDTWTDDYRHNTYLTIIAHICIKEKEDLKYHRFVLTTTEITDTVKTGEVLVGHILKCFGEYGISEEDVKKNMIFLSDRGANIRYGLIKAGFQRLACYAHLIYNLVTHMLEETRVKQIVGQASTLSSYIKNCGMNKHLKISLKRHTVTSIILQTAIIENYEAVYDLPLDRQRLQNEIRLRRNEQPDDKLSSLITVYTSYKCKL